ncbi:type I-E CRISPR-associated protein Cse2/CasB [Actinomadura hibisca]|uniref:type I-E CRISPR-associated protein Cse2/CasB n=1 Tax=Actinomadura hibisca TaxID=68565 RepID=UPI00082D5B33|nr:type I-E CRISPR-associated protein Cse2/CasB [Actinomadura hibisca]
MTATPHAVRPLVENTAGRFITELQGGYLADKPAAVGTLAQLRRGAGKLPAQTPELWGVTGTDLLLRADRLADNDTLAERAETGYFVAITLYAAHQQSQSTPVHKRGVDLGEAVRRLMPPGDIEETIRRRFVRLGTAGTAAILAYRLREIVSLLRTEGVPLDYGRLAGQLYLAQTPDGMSRVRREWGRSFHTHKADPDEDTP